MIKYEKYGADADWWALGILVFEMLTGTPSFSGEEPEEIFSKITSNPIDFPSDMNEASVQVIQDLTKPTREQRLREPEDIKMHTFFDGINWKKLAKKEFVPPYIPEIEDSYDFRMIDSEFLVMSVDSFTSGSYSTDSFEGFSYRSKSIT